MGLTNQQGAAGETALLRKNGGLVNVMSVMRQSVDVMYDVILLWCHVNVFYLRATW